LASSPFNTYARARPRCASTPIGEFCNALGLIENAVGNGATIEIPLRPDDRVVIYTDGFTESCDSRERELGIDGFSEIVREAALWPHPEMKQHILDRVAAFRNGPPSDDMSLVIVSMT
jgi:serine phosphatase RsbU (regulator of sigma subunit)